MGKPAHGAEQWYFRLIAQTHAQLQRALIVLFGGEPRGVVITLYIRIGFRVPGVGVDAVEDSGKQGLSLREQPFQSHSERFTLDLLRVARTDRGNSIGELQPALQKRSLAVVFDAID